MVKSKEIGSVSIGRQLRKFREHEGMTQYQMAAFLHLGESTYGNYERGEREPDIDTLKRVCDRFNITMDVMVGRQNRNPYGGTDDIRRLREELQYIEEKVHEILDTIGRGNGRGAR